MGFCIGVNVTTDGDTNETHSDLHFASEDEAAHTFVFFCEAIIIPIINLFAVITNIWTLLILPRTRIVDAFKICLISLTICDFLASLISFVNIMLEIRFYDGDIPFGIWENAAVTCYVLHYISCVFICSSATYVIAIVVIRYWIINSPVKARYYLTPGNTKKVCFCLFLATLLFYLPTSLIIMFQSCSRDKQTQICIDTYKAIPNLKRISSYYVGCLVLLYGPILVMLYIVSLVRIKISLTRNNKELDSLTARDASRYTTIMHCTAPHCATLRHTA